MIEKIDKIRDLLIVLSVDEQPKIAINQMKILNLLVELRAEAEQLTIPSVSSSFKVGTYSLHKQGDSGYCHWSEGLKMVIEKDGVVMKLEGEEIEKIVRSLPRTFGGAY